MKFEFIGFFQFIGLCCTVFSFSIAFAAGILILFSEHLMIITRILFVIMAAMAIVAAYYAAKTGDYRR